MKFYRVMEIRPRPVQVAGVAPARRSGATPQRPEPLSPADFMRGHQRCLISKFIGIKEKIIDIVFEEKHANIGNIFKKKETNTAGGSPRGSPRTPARTSPRVSRISPRSDRRSPQWFGNIILAS